MIFQTNLDVLYYQLPASYSQLMQILHKFTYINFILRNASHRFLLQMADGMHYTIKSP